MSVTPRKRILLVCSSLLIAAIGFGYLNVRVMSGLEDCRFTDVLPWPPARCAEWNTLAASDMFYYLSFVSGALAIIAPVLILFRRRENKNNLEQPLSIKRN